MNKSRGQEADLFRTQLELVTLLKAESASWKVPMIEDNRVSLRHSERMLAAGLAIVSGEDVARLPHPASTPGEALKLARRCSAHLREQLQFTRRNKAVWWRPNADASFRRGQRTRSWKAA